MYYKVGSGKTLAAAYAAVEMIMRNIISSAVVVLPSAIEKNFRGELTRAIPDPEMRRRIHVYSMQGNLQDALRHVRGNLLVIDEAHNLRNGGKRFLAVHRLSKAARKVLVMTATPVYNYPKDIARLLTLVEPGANHAPRGPAGDAGGWVLENTITNNKNEIDVLFDKHFGVTGSKTGSTSNLQRFLKCKVLYYEPNGADLSDFPTSTEHFINVAMGPKSTKEQLDLASDSKPSADTGDLEAFMRGEKAIQKVISFLRTYRLLGNGVIKDGDKIKEVEGHKIRLVLSAVRDLHDRGLKSVIYSEFLEVIDILKRELEDVGIECGVFTGDRKDLAGGYSKVSKTRVLDQQAYNDGHLRVMFISKAGSEGLSLRGTAAMFIMEPSWNEESQRQIIGRVVRFGSHRGSVHTHVDIYRYIARLPRGAAKPAGMSRKLMEKGTADERLLHISKLKSKISNRFLSLVKKLANDTMTRCRASNVNARAYREANTHAFSPFSSPISGTPTRSPSRSPSRSPNRSPRRGDTPRRRSPSSSIADVSSRTGRLSIK